MRRNLFAKLRYGVLPVLGLCAQTSCTPPRVSSTVYLTWKIVDASQPNPLTAPALDCNSKNVQWVRVQLAGGPSFDFPCNSYSGESTSFSSGTYSVDVIALNPTGAAVSAQRVSMDLFGRTNLGNYIFQVR